MNVERLCYEHGLSDFERKEVHSNEIKSLLIKGGDIY